MTCAKAVPTLFTPCSHDSSGQPRAWDTAHAPELLAECIRVKMSTNNGNKGGLPRPWVLSPQFKDGQTGSWRKGLSVSTRMRPMGSEARSFCLTQSLCEPRLPSLGLEFLISSPEVGYVGSEGELGLFTGFRKGLGPSGNPHPKPRRKRGRDGGSCSLPPQPPVHPYPRWPAHLQVPSSSPTHCSARNIPIQAGRQMTTLPGEQAMDQNKLQPSFLLAMLTQVQGRASQEMARLHHTSSSGTGPSQELLRGSGTRRPVSLAPAHYCYKPKKAY